MPQVNTSLNDDTIRILKDVAKKENKSFSKIMSEMILKGLNNHHELVVNDTQKIQELENKHSEYLIRILSICSEILRKNYGDESKYNTNNAADILNIIKESSAKYVDTFVTKNGSVAKKLMADKFLFCWCLRYTYPARL